MLIERVMGTLNPRYLAWEASVLPLNYTRTQLKIIPEYWGGAVIGPCHASLISNLFTNSYSASPPSPLGCAVRNAPRARSVDLVCGFLGMQSGALFRQLVCKRAHILGVDWSFSPPLRE